MENNKNLPNKCTKCEYQTINKIMYKQHILNKHATLEEKEIGFKFYCKLCDYGSFFIDLYENHLKSKKHIRITKKNINL